MIATYIRNYTNVFIQYTYNISVVTVSYQKRSAVHLILFKLVYKMCREGRLSQRWPQIHLHICIGAKADIIIANVYNSDYVYINFMPIIEI